jgi:1,2-diacylglycerol 3-alpha-glucosyltransferase
MKNRRHIGFFTNTYLPTMSGVVRSIVTFKQAFDEMGHNVFVFAQKTAKYYDEEPFIFRYPAVEFPFANDYALPVPFSSSIDDTLPCLKLDVIHSHHPFILGETAARKAETLHLPLVFTFHTRYNEYAHYIPFSKELTRLVVERRVENYLEKCQHIVTPSDSIRKILIDNGVEGDITTVPTGIDLDPFRSANGDAIRQKFGWAEEDTILISVGRLAKEKSFDTLLEAAASVMTDRPQVRLAIVGSGMEERKLKKLARELGIADRVDFVGSVPYEQVPNYLKAADLFSFASLTETQGLVTMEAMAAGLPVVAVEATGTSDAVTNGRDGLLTANNSAALAQALGKVIDNPGLKEQLVEGAAKRIAWFDIDYQAQRMLQVYDEAMIAKKERRHIVVRD